MASGFNKNSINLIAAPKGDSLNYRSAPNTTASVLHNSKKGFSAGRTSGDFYGMPDGIWWAVVLNSNGQTAYVREDVTTFIKPSSNPTITDTQAQGIVNDLVKSDVEIFHALLRCNALITAAKNKNLNVTALQTQYTTLLTRLNARQSKIKTSKLLSYKTGLKKGYESLSEGFVKGMTTPAYYGGIIYGIGSVAAVVIGAIIGAGLAVGIYYAFKPSYSESQADLKVSSDLEKALSTLTPDEANKVKADLEKQIDDAYNAGSTDGTFGGIMKIAKPVLIGVGGFLLVSYLIRLTQPRNK
jgi:hypothetical protein